MSTIIRIDRLSLPLMIGILDFERDAPQIVTISIDMSVETGPDPDDYVSYAPIVEHLQALSASRRHIDLVEQLADEIFAFIFNDTRVRTATVSVMKPEIFAEAAGVGVVMTRDNPAQIA